MIFCIKPETDPIKETFFVKQVDKNYKLLMMIYSSNMSIEISEMNKFMQSYEIKLNLEQIKEKHNSFSKFLSLLEFRKIIKDNYEKKAINITKTSDNLILFELKKNSVFFELTKKKISIEELVENLNIEREKYNQKLSELVIIRKIKNEMDETKKNNEILCEENKKLREEIKYIKEENIIKNQEILNLKQDLQVIKSYIEKLEDEEVKPICTRKISFKEEYEKRNKIDIISREINNIISENEEKNKQDIFKKNNGYYKIEMFEEKEKLNVKQKEGNNKNKIEYDFFRKRNLTARKNTKFLNIIPEEFDNNKSFKEIIQTEYNIKKDENIESHEKLLIKKENNTKKITKNKTIQRINNFNTNKLSRNNSRQSITPTKVNDRRFSSHSVNKQKYT